MSAADDLHVVIDELALPSRGDAHAFAAAVAAQLTRLLQDADGIPESDVRAESRRTSLDSGPATPAEVAAVLAHVVRRAQP